MLPSPPEICTAYSPSRLLAPLRSRSSSRFAISMADIGRV